MRSKIKAITFDLWDTLFADDTDEPKRQKAGLPPNTGMAFCVFVRYNNRMRGKQER